MFSVGWVRRYLRQMQADLADFAIQHGSAVLAERLSTKRTQAFLSSFYPIRKHFALKRHLLRPPLYRKHLAAQFAAWRDFTNVAQTPSNAF